LPLAEYSRHQERNSLVDKDTELAKTMVKEFYQQKGRLIEQSISRGIERKRIQIISEIIVFVAHYRQQLLKEAQAIWGLAHKIAGNIVNNPSLSQEIKEPTNDVIETLQNAVSLFIETNTFTFERMEQLYLGIRGVLQGSFTLVNTAKETGQLILKLHDYSICFEFNHDELEGILKSAYMRIHS
jgi:hypothetical protein